MLVCSHGNYRYCVSADVLDVTTIVFKTDIQIYSKKINTLYMHTLEMHSVGELCRFPTYQYLE